MDSKMDAPEDTGKHSVSLLSWEMLPFLTLFGGQSISLFGSRLVQFAIVWWLTETSGSASVLATATIMAVLPQVVIAPFAGAIVDRWSRRLVMMVSDSLVALAVLLLAYLYSGGGVQVWQIYLIMFFRSSMDAFQWPAMQASTSMMVPKEHLPRVAGLRQSVQGIVNILAPPMGAVLLGFLPVYLVLGIDVLTAILAVGPLFFIAIPQPVRGDTSARGVLSDMKEGFRFIWERKTMMSILEIALVLNMVSGPAFSLLPLLVVNHFKGSAIELAYLQSASGVGLITGGIILGVWGGFKRRVETAFTALTASGLGIIGIGLAPGNLLWAAVVSIFVFGIMNSISNGSFFSVIQTVIPNELQGRVFTLVMSASVAVMPLGLAIAAPVAEVIGVRSWFLISGAVTIGAGIYGLLNPRIRGFEDTLTTE
ncbi:MAG: MFS transporter [Candidatus Bathyarchaeota archaeon]